MNPDPIEMERQAQALEREAAHLADTAAQLRNELPEDVMSGPAADRLRDRFATHALQLDRAAADARAAAGDLRRAAALLVQGGPRG